MNDRPGAGARRPDAAGLRHQRSGGQARRTTSYAHRRRRLQLNAFRISKAKYVSTAFEGVGSKKAGGCWNSPGRAVVYASENRATAALEILVHVRRAQLLRDAYVIFKLDVPGDLVSVLDLRALPSGWDAPIETPASTDIGDAWFDARASVALRVPGVAIRGETNVLLNPVHPDFGQVVIGPPEPFLFDVRLER